MPVTSRDLDALMADLPPLPAARTMPKGATSAPPRAAPIPRAYGFAALLFGLPAWPLGAFFTAAGWAMGLNWILSFLGVPYQIPAPTGLIGVGCAAVVGLIYSRIEFHPPTRHRTPGVMLLLWAVWVAIIVTDVGSTYAGIAIPGPITAVVATLLTFAPDQLIMRGWRIVRGVAPF
jgi:hypothetical protein